MKCVVLGGGGFLGSNLCRALYAAGHDITVLERPKVGWAIDFPEGDAVHWIEGDFTNEIDLETVLAGAEVVYHLVSATLPKTSNDNPIYDLEVNVAGTLRLLNVALKTGVKRIVFASSGGTVYGLPKATPIEETHPVAPVCAYGIGKLAIEKYLFLYQHLHGLDYRVLRLSNPYGEGQNPLGSQGVVAVFSHRAIKRQPIEVWGDGSVVRDYIFIDDAVAAFVNAATHSGTERLFNIGSGLGHSLNEVIETIERVLGYPLEVRRQESRGFDVPANVLSIDQARRELEWQPKVSLDEGIKRTIAWLTRR